MEGISVPHKIFANIIPLETVSSWTKRKWTKWKVLSVSQNSTGRKQADRNLLRGQYMPFFMKKGDLRGGVTTPEGRQGSRAEAWATWGTPELWNFMEFAQDFDRMVTAFCLTFFSRFNCEWLLTVTPVPLPALYFWSRDLLSSFTGSQIRGFCPRTVYTQDCTHTWFRDLRLLSWWDLDSGILDLSWSCNWLRLSRTLGWVNVFLTHKGSGSEIQPLTNNKIK